MINTDKCEIIHFGSKNPHLKYKISNVEIHKTDVVLDLGLLVDNPLNFIRQTNAVRAKCFYLLHFVFKLLHSNTPDIYINFYNQYVIPIVDYCAIFTYLFPNQTHSLLKRYDSWIDRLMIAVYNYFT